MIKVQAIDIDKCLRGMSSFSIHGIPQSGKREQLICEALEKIKDNPETALSKEYLGYKNYAHFGDQRCDCTYGMGPSHGSIVFSIRRNRENTEPVDFDAVSYLFMAALDFGFVGQEKDRRTIRLNLCDVLTEMRLLELKYENHANSIDNIEYGRVKEFTT